MFESLKFDWHFSRNKGDKERWTQEDGKHRQWYYKQIKMGKVHHRTILAVSSKPVNITNLVLGVLDENVCHVWFCIYYKLMTTYL